MTTSEVGRYSLSHLLTVIGDTQSCQYFRSLQNQQTPKLGELETHMERVRLHFPLSTQDIVVAISNSGLQRNKKKKTSGHVLFLNSWLFFLTVIQFSLQYCRCLAYFPSAHFWLQVGGKCLVLLSGWCWRKSQNMAKVELKNRVCYYILYCFRDRRDGGGVSSCPLPHSVGKKRKKKFTEKGDCIAAVLGSSWEPSATESAVHSSLESTTRKPRKDIFGCCIILILTVFCDHPISIGTWSMYDQRKWLCPCNSHPF